MDNQIVRAAVGSPFDENALLGVVRDVRIYAYHIPDPGADFQVLPGDDPVWSEVRELARQGGDPIVLTPLEEAELFESSGWQRHVWLEGSICKDRIIQLTKPTDGTRQTGEALFPELTYRGRLGDAD